MKAIKIDFLENEYNVAMQLFTKKCEIQQKIDNELRALLRAEPFAIADYNNVLNEFYKIIEEQKKDSNTLQLKGAKLVELLDINISNLLLLQSDFQMQGGDTTEPKISAFTVFAESEGEIQKYHECMAVIDALNKFEKYELPLNKQNWVRFMPFISFALDSEQFKPSVYFIKGGKYI